MFNGHNETKQVFGLFGKLFSICKADEILNSKDYSYKISELRNADMVSPDIFDEYYWHLLSSFFDYLQFLPDSREKNLPLINVALARVKLAFDHVSKYKDSRFQYAYISLAALIDIGVCLSDYEIIITDYEGKPLDIWHPFVRGLSDYSDYHYKIRPCNFYNKKIRYQANPIIACKIMPESGLNFIKEDPVLFGQWLSALLGQDDGGDLAADLDAIKSFSQSSMVGSNLDSSIISSDMYADAEAFWHWLQSKLQEGKNCSVKSGEINFDLDAMAKEYAGVNNLNYSELKRKLLALGVVKADQVRKKVSAGFSGLSMFDTKVKDSKVNCKITTSVNLSGQKYYRDQTSIADSNNKIRASISNSQQQNQQMT